MEIIRYPQEPCRGRSVTALGVFDGVHIGHRALLAAAREEAKRLGLCFSVFTFSEGGGLKEGSPRIYREEEKLRLLEDLGTERVILCDFPAVRDLAPGDFVREVLIGALGCAVAVCGFDFRFGRGASGGAQTLAEEMKKNGASALTVPPVLRGGEPVSSSAIRRLLAEGKVREANLLLGAPYHTEGEAEPGLALGRTHGVPTLNGAAEAEGLLPRGVYRTAVKIGSELFPSVTDLGSCPTLGERPVHTETHLLLPFPSSLSGGSPDLYGKEYTLYFLDFLREERAFSSEKDLYLQINVDISKVKEAFSADPGWKASLR